MRDGDEKDAKEPIIDKRVSTCLHPLTVCGVIGFIESHIGGVV